LQPYKGYFIEGSALLIHPFNPRTGTLAGSVLKPGWLSSIIEIVRFEPRFAVSKKELAE
jgi:hypothetical protein